MIELSLALRNLNRNKRRSIATLLAMAIGSTAILMFSGYSANIRYSMQTAYARNSGHLQIQHRDFFLYGSGNPSAYGIQNYQQLVQAIKSDPSLAGQVTVVTPTLQFGAIAGNYAAGVSRTVVGVGMVAVDHNRMRAWNEYGLPLHSPTFALEGAAPDAAIVGVGVARVLQLCDRLEIKDCPSPIEQQPQLGKVLPSDIATLAMSEAPAAGVATIAIPHAKLDLLASTANGTPNVVSLQVIRAERQGFKELDEVYLMLNLQQAQRLIYGRSSPKATSIMIQLSRTEQIPSARDRLTKLVAEVLPYQPLSLRDFR